MLSAVQAAQASQKGHDLCADWTPSLPDRWMVQKFANSPNSCLQHGVLAKNLLIDWCVPVLLRANNLNFCHTSAVILTFSNHRISESCSSSRESALCKLRHVHPSSRECQTQNSRECHVHPSSNVAGVPAILKISNCAISLRPSLSSKSFKNDSNS